VSRFDTGAGRSDWEDPAAQPRQLFSSTTEVERTPTAPDSADTHQQDAADSATAPREAPDVPTPSVPRVRRRPRPRGWPAKQAEAIWSFMEQPLPPLRIMVGGAEGGAGTSTVTALLGELIAAASPGPTVVVDQNGSAWNSLARRLSGDQGGMPTAQAVNMLKLGATSEQVIGLAPRTSAGAALVEDARGYTPLHEITRLGRSRNGTVVVDSGRIDHVFAARLDIHPAVIVVGRADVVGAEAVCAALDLLRQAHQPRPIVVLSSSTSPSSAATRRRVQAAAKLVAAAGITHLVHLPHDPRLASGRPMRLDQVSKQSATAAMRLLARVVNLQGENDAHRRPAPPGPAAGPTST
jgi:MinD-like ATPase involved in chromosome partitioning or flagellar assembly